MSAARTEPLRPNRLSKEGTDRLVIEWNDGHDAGIYTLENLRELCEPLAE